MHETYYQSVDQLIDRLIDNMSHALLLYCRRCTVAAMKQSICTVFPLSGRKSANRRFTLSPHPTSEDPILNTKLQNEKNEIGLHYTFLHIRYYGEKIMTDNFRTYILK